MNETPVIEIHIKIKDTVSIQGDRSAVSIVSFSGEASSPSFKGKVLPGAADTQIKRADGTKTLSARYILEGVDSEGNACKIFIENNGTDNGGEIRTTPTVITDSPALKHLETAPLYGSVVSENGDLIVRIFEEDNR